MKEPYVIRDETITKLLHLPFISNAGRVVLMEGIFDAYSAATPRQKKGLSRLKLIQILFAQSDEN